MKLKEALQRIEELERRVKELEEKPKQVFEYHFHQPAPVYVPAPIYIPQPQPWYPTGPTWTSGDIQVLGHTGAAQ